MIAGNKNHRQLKKTPKIIVLLTRPGPSTDDNAETDGNIPKNLDTSGSLNTSTDSVSVKKASPMKLWKNTSKPSEENIRDSTLLMDTSRDLDISTEVEPIANKFPSKRAENVPKDNAQTTSKLDTSSDSLPGPGRPPVTKTPVSTLKEKTQRSMKMSFVSGGTLVPLGKRVTTPNTERAATLGRSHSTPSSAVPHWSKVWSLMHCFLLAFFGKSLIIDLLGTQVVVVKVGQIYVPN